MGNPVDAADVADYRVLQHVGVVPDFGGGGGGVVGHINIYRVSRDLLIKVSFS